MRKVVRALLPLRYLRDDWDGQGAAAPPIGVVDTAIDLAGSFARNDMPTPTAVAPTPAGSIVFAWDNPSADIRYIEVEVMAPGRLDLMRIDADGIATHGQISRPEGLTCPA